MIYVIIAFALGAFFVYVFLHELRNTIRDRNFVAFTGILANANKQDEEKWIPVDDEENLEEQLEEENREEEADEGDDDAILGL